MQLSDDRVITALDVADVAIWECDIGTGRIKWSGRLVERILGGEAEHAVTIDKLESLLHPDDREEACRKAKDALNEKKRFVHEFRTVGLPDGELRWLSVLGHGIYSEQGVPVRMTGAVADVTERRQAQDRLREREQIYSSIVSQAEDGILLIDPETLEFIEFNDAFCRRLGYTREEFTGLKLSDIQTMSVEQVREKLAQLLERRGLVFENVHRAKDGSTRNTRVSVQVVKVGERDLLAGIATDITETKRREAALRENAMFLREVEKIARIGGWKANTSTNYLKWTEGVYDIIEAPLDYFPDIPEGGKFYLPEYLDDLLGNINRCLETGEPFKMECEVLTTSQKRLWTEVRGVASVGEGDDAYVIGTFQDISERKRVEQQLIEYQERLRSLSAELARVQNRERRQLAASLHDNVAQSLALSTIKLGRLRDSVSEEHKASIDPVCALIEDAIESTRLLMDQLSPPTLHELGLDAALHSLMDQIHSENGLSCSFESNGEKHVLSDDMRVLLYMVTRELMLNVVKHAKAEELATVVDWSDDRITIVVRDNGIGFDPVAVLSPYSETARFGLFSVKERLRDANGELRIRSEPGKGTEAVITVPLGGRPALRN